MYIVQIIVDTFLNCMYFKHINQLYYRKHIIMKGKVQFFFLCTFIFGKRKFKNEKLVEHDFVNYCQCV